MVSIFASGTGCAAPTGAWAASRTRRAAPALLMLAGLGGAASPPLLPAPPPPTADQATLEVVFSDLRSARGLLRLCLTSDPANFPDCTDDAHAVTRTVPADTGSLRIEALPLGSYALAVIHDENGNARLDTFAGIPREGFGFSRNPGIGFGPPRFAAARFALAADGGVQTVRLRYLL